MLNRTTKLSKILGTHISPLFRNGPFMRFWGAQTVSDIGDQVTVVALPLVAVLVLRSSAFQVGLLSAAGLLPNLLISLHAGAWVDRWGRRRETMILMDAGSAILLASIPLAYFGGFLTLAQLYMVAFLVGSMGVVFNVANQGLFASVVPREHYLQAMSLSRGTFSFSWVVGPSLAGVLVQALQAPFAILADVASFIGSALLLHSVKTEEPVSKGPGGGSIREGLRFVYQSPPLRAKFVAASALNLFYSIYFALFLLFAARDLHLSAGLIGLAISGGAVGALLGSMVTNRIVGRIGLGVTFIIGSLVYPAALVLVPLAGGSEVKGFVMFTLAEFVSGAGLMLLDISGSTIQQAITPDQYRARVQGAYQAFTYGSRPVGALLGGTLASVYGLRPVIMVAVIGGVLSVIPVFASPIPTMREIPEESA